jgi:hypothetical protein
MVALVPLHRRLQWDQPFAGTTVLQHTIARLQRCTLLEGIVIIAEHDTQLPPLPGVHRVASLSDVAMEHRLAARKWSPAAWRGGLGGMTCYDEVLAPASMVEALDAVGAPAGLLVGADWPLVDPGLCDAVIERHLSQPERLKLVFTQAPPGMAGCVITRDLLMELRDKHATIGALLDYQPLAPQGDPIGKDPCVQIDHVIRNAPGRFVCEAGRWGKVMRTLEPMASADALTIVKAAAPALAHVHDEGPEQLTIELTTRRRVSGPLAPAVVQRPDITLDRVTELLREFWRGVVTFGGLGDPLLHAEWPAMVRAAAAAGVSGVHVQTDLIVDQRTLETLLELPIDVVSVNLSADTPGTYAAVMGGDHHAQVVANIEWLLNNRKRFGKPLMPWIVPRFVKTAANVHELELFFDRWSYYCGHAVIESPATGCGSTADLAVMDMSPPRRRSCRQLGHRMTVHSDGAVALCDQDWRGGSSASLSDGWKRIAEVRAEHAAGRYGEPCDRCREWHRP